jgi:hypothetical protein
VSYIRFDAITAASPWLAIRARVFKRTKAMTTEIIHLTTQIQRWLNLQVARHLAAQAERFEPVKH